MIVSKTSSLTDIELEDLTAICYREQGRSEAGIKACASQMCNYHDAFWADKNKTPYQTVIHSGWYGSAQNVVDGMLTYRNLVTDAMIDWVRDVVCRGNRTLPEYVVEYDVLTDVRKATNNGIPIDRLDRSQYIKDVTKIQNIYGSESDSYTFYCFPDGVEGNCDAFGYFSKPKEAEDMTTAEKATRWMEALASDNSHGYDQIYRWGEKGDYDCSSAVITAWEQAGVPVKSNGATYTGNMYAVFTKYGFKDVTNKVNLATGAGLKRSDVLLNHVHHVAMYCGNGMEVEASINEKGSAKYGIPGDQTGREILIREYRNYPWDCVLRYESTDEELVDEITIEPEPEPAEGAYMFTTSTVQNGTKGASARLLQTLLKGLGYYGANGKVLTIDGDAGANTIHALKSYQRHVNLTADGICGPATWKKILGV